MESDVVEYYEFLNKLGMSLQFIDSIAPIFLGMGLVLLFISILKLITKKKGIVLLIISIVLLLVGISMKNFVYSVI